MLVFDLLSQGSIFSYIVVEIGWLSFLWVLWLSTGSYAAWTDGELAVAFPGETNCVFGIFSTSQTGQTCHDIKGIMALSFLIWILLMSYTVTLLVLAIRAQARGKSVWTAGVRDGALFKSLRYSTGITSQVQGAPPAITYSPPAPKDYLPYSSSNPSEEV